MNNEKFHVIMRVCARTALLVVAMSVHPRDTPVQRSAYVLSRRLSISSQSVLIDIYSNGIIERKQWNGPRSQQ